MGEVGGYFREEEDVSSVEIPTNGDGRKLLEGTIDVEACKPERGRGGAGGVVRVGACGVFEFVGNGIAVRIEVGISAEAVVDEPVVPRGAIRSAGIAVEGG